MRKLKIFGLNEVLFFVGASAYVAGGAMLGLHVSLVLDGAALCAVAVGRAVLGASR